MAAPQPPPVPSSARHGRRNLPVPLGELLREKGLVDQAGLERAFEHKRKTGQKLGQALVELKLLSESGLAEMLRWQGRLPCIVLSPKLIDVPTARLLPENDARKLGAIPVNRIAGIVTVAVEDPSDLFVVDELQRALGGRVFAVYAEPARIRECLNSTWSSSPGSIQLRDVAPGRIAMPKRAEPEASTAPWDIRQQLPDLMRTTLEAAVAGDAISVHFEPRAQGLAIRVRLRQGLRERQLLPSEWTTRCLDWLRTLVGLPTDRIGVCAEGRGTIELAGSEHVAFVSIVPGPHGDAATVRVRPRGGLRPGLETLELAPGDEERLAGLLARREGLVVSAGLVGSGVTTTLHGMLRQLVRADKKLVSLEDPVEVLFDGVMQVDASVFRGRPQSAALRALLRHDPDVMMIGELAEPRAFEVVEHAATSGVLVLAGLRAHSAGAAIGLLRRLGAGRSALRHLVAGILVQRALRKVCPACATAVPLGDEHRRELARLGVPADGLAVRRGNGCDACRGRGLHGSLHLRELVLFDGPFATAAVEGASDDDLDAWLSANGGSDLAARALAAAREGTVCVEELLRCMQHH